MRLSRLLGGVSVLLAASLVLTACGDDDNGPKPVATGAIAGTLTLPASAPGKHVIVIADKDRDGDNDWVRDCSGLCASGRTQDYLMTGVPVGDYYVYAVVFVHGAGSSGPVSGDYAGFHGGTLSSPPQTRTITVRDSDTAAANIQLYVMP